MKRLPFSSQAKIATAFALPTSLVLFFLFLLLQAAGFFRSREEIEFGYVLMALALISALFAAGIAAVQIVALGILRLLPWQGPSLEIEEPGNPDLAGIFE